MSTGSSIVSGQAAIDAIQPEIDAMADDSVGMYNLDAAYVATQLANALPRIEALHALLQKLFEFDIAAVRKLPLYVQALLHADGLVVAHSPETSEFDAHAITARSLRESFLCVAEVFVNRGELAQSVVDEIRAGQGVLDLISDLVALRAALEPRTDGALVRHSDMATLIQLINDLPAAYAQHLGKDPKLAPLLTQLRKIGALLTFAYAEAQAGVRYVRRRANDADDIAPSIYVPRGQTKKGGEKGEKGEKSDKPAPEPGPTPAPSPARPANPLEPSDHPFDDKR